MPAPVAEPNIFPGNWTVKTQQLLRTYEQSFVQDWNPVTLSWDTLDPTGLDLKERIAQAYWMAKLALFEKLGVLIPAIHEIDLEGEEVDIRKDEPVATPF